MGRIGCTINGDLDESKLNEPMPWIEIYVATASAACAVAVAADAAKAFRYKKFWFPCQIFSLNSTTLTLIAVAVKFSVDLNTSMPHRQDQLAKVSSSAFICMIISNFMPSVGNMDNNELMMNILALGILVLTAMRRHLLEVPFKWPIKVLAVNSMYRICQTILLDYKGRDYACNEKSFGKLFVSISSILRACFANLHHVIFKQCHRSRIEVRLQSIHNVVLLFGRIENILKIVDQPTVEYAHPGQLVHIDEWNLLCK